MALSHDTEGGRPIGVDLIPVDQMGQTDPATLGATAGRESDFLNAPLDTVSNRCRARRQVAEVLQVGPSTPGAGG